MKSLIYRLTAIVYVCLCALAFKAGAVTPTSPQLAMRFEFIDGVGTVSGTVTASNYDSSWSQLPADTKMKIVVTRSCEELNETGVVVAEYDNVAPGTKIDFQDHAEPAWQYGVKYGYTPMAYIGINASPYPYKAELTPGVNFPLSDKDMKVSNGENGSAVISVTIPTTMGYPPTDIPVEMTRLEYHRVTNASVYPYPTEFIHSIDNPQKGSTYEYVDQTPTPNATNVYVIKLFSDYGRSEGTVRGFVGYDIPRAPTDIKAVSYQGGVKIEWQAPVEGINWGAIDTTQTRYNVYRCWGSGKDFRKQIAERIAEREFVDYATDIEAPMAVRYEVQSVNNIGEGQSNFSSSDYRMLVGPSYTLPLWENFANGAMQLVWKTGNSNYYATLDADTKAYYGASSTVVEPKTGTGLLYVDYQGYGIREGSSNTLTSYMLDLGKAATPVASFTYYAIPNNDVYIDFAVSTDGTSFTSLRKTIISLDVAEPEWRTVDVPLSDYIGKVVHLRLTTGFTSAASSAIIDEIKVADYLPVGDISVETNAADCSATLSWADPSSELTKVTAFRARMDGEDMGEVTSPWTVTLPDYGKVHTFTIQAIYGTIEAPISASVSASVARPVADVFEANGYVFAIVKDAPSGVNQVRIRKYNGKAELIKIPELVDYDNRDFTVVGIEDEAFKGLGIVTVTFPNSVVSIGCESFADCPELMAVSFGKGLTSIGERAFAGCSSLAKVKFTSTEVPEVAADAFTGIADYCEGSCPDESVEAYSSAPALQGISFLTADISSIATDARVEYFTLHGRPTTPTRGTIVIARITHPTGQIQTAKVKR